MPGVQLKRIPSWHVRWEGVACAKREAQAGAGLMGPNSQHHSHHCKSCCGASCLSVIYNTYGMNYTRVCGRVIGYEDRSPSAFSGNSNGQRSIDSIYLDGVSVTYGPPGARQHIWSFAASLTETGTPIVWSCPCANRTNLGRVPSYVGNDYFCESGNPGPGSVTEFYPSDPLWDGEGCGVSTCCELSYPPGVTPPWFCKQLPQATTDDIEVRLCADEATTNEDTPLELIELYIH